MAQCPLLSLQDMGVVAADAPPADVGETPFVCLALPNASPISSRRLADYCLGDRFLACDRYPTDADPARPRADTQGSRTRWASAVATFAAGLGCGLLILAGVLLLDDKPSASGPRFEDGAAGASIDARGVVEGASPAWNAVDDRAAERPVHAPAEAASRIVEPPAPTADPPDAAPEAPSSVPEVPGAAPTGSAESLTVPSVAAWPVVTTWKVKGGDTLAAIARDWHTTSESIAALNGLTDPNVIRAGQVLQVPLGYPPPPTSIINPAVLPELHSWRDMIEWRVRPGDSLRAIAAAFATSVEALIATNWPLHPDHIYVNAILRVPRGFGR